MAIRAEYIWIDGSDPTPLLRSKTKVLPDADTLPIWGFDGSSTNQAPGKASDCVLQPVFFCPDPMRGGDHVLVLDQGRDRHILQRIDGLCVRHTSRFRTFFMEIW